MVEVRKEEGETFGSLLYRFNKKIQQSGVLKEAKKRRFYKRSENRNQRRVSAVRRVGKRQEMEKAKKLGKSLV